MVLRLTIFTTIDDERVGEGKETEMIEFIVVKRLMKSEIDNDIATYFRMYKYLTIRNSSSQTASKGALRRVKHVDHVHIEVNNEESLGCAQQ